MVGSDPGLGESSHQPGPDRTMSISSSGIGGNDERCIVQLVERTIGRLTSRCQRVIDPSCRGLRSNDGAPKCYDVRLVSTRIAEVQTTYTKLL